MENPGVEQPIYIESFAQLRRHWFTATNGDAVHRFPVRLEAIWNQYGLIPDVPAATLLLDNDAAGVVALRKSRALTLVAGTTRKYEIGAAPGTLSFVVTATQGQVAPVAGSAGPTLNTPPAPGTGYTPVIQDAAGAVFPMQASEWVVDGLNNFVEFPYGVPAAMVPPLAITFYQYTGTFGGSGGGGAHPWERVADVTGTSVRLNLAFPTAVTDDVVFPAQSTEGASRRVFFDESAAAFRGGEATGAQWDAASRGTNSTAFGLDTVASGIASAVGGGRQNTASNSNAAIAGGFLNTATASGAAVAGGSVNAATGSQAAIGGGQSNTASSNDSVIGGGNGNTSSNFQTTVAGGQGNVASASGATVGGGQGNAASGLVSAVSGGLLNVASDDYATVGGGENNTASSDHATVGGGEDNTASNDNATVGGGTGNTASGVASTVGGGNGNSATVIHSTVAGGAGNMATGLFATVGGGEANTASGDHATIGGGDGNTAVGAFSWAGGDGSTVALGHDNAFVWSDGTARASTAADEVTFGAAGGFRAFGAGATGTPVYVGGQIYLDAATTVVTGKLTVDGVIDPPGVVMTEGAAVPQAPIAGEGTFWVRNDAPNVPMFTDDAGTDFVLNAGAAAIWEWNASVLRTDTAAPGYTIAGDFVFGSQSLDDAGVASDARFFFDKSVGSFRAGQVDGTQWDAGSRGDHSVAFGENTTASGAHSTVGGGTGNVASGAGAVTPGGTTNTAAGDNSFAGGNGSTIGATEDNAFVWSDGTGGRTATAADEVTFGADGGFRVFGSGATGLPAYVGGQIYLDAATTVVTGKLTVDGVIDPPGVVMTEGAAVPQAPIAGEGTWWVQNLVPNVPMFTDDAGTDHVIVTNVTQVWEYAAGPLLRPLATGTGYDINADFVFGSQSLDDAGAASDARFFFDKGVGSFRAGQVDGTQWDAGSRGDHSVAFGENTTASGAHSAVGGGDGNTASGTASTVGGGETNTAPNNYSTVGGGRSNSASAVDATVGGGNTNAASSADATVGGGMNNTASGTASTIGGGSGNTVPNNNATVGGGTGNATSAADATVGGGNGNTASGGNSTVGGGMSNTASGADSTVGGGNGNTASGNDSTVGGGRSNTASALGTTVGGGRNNVASATRAGVFSGDANVVDNTTAAICGGDGNDIGVVEPGGISSFIGAGSGNRIGNHRCGIVAGDSNTITGTGDWCCVGAGRTNSVAAPEAGILAGNSNSVAAASDRAGVVAGGSNTASADDAFVGAGASNTASGDRGGVVCGSSNTASGADSVVTCGAMNTAAGASSWAGGGGSTIAVGHDNAFVWSDITARSSTAANEVTFGAAGGFRAFGAGATGLPAYVGGQIYLDAATTVVTGKLTVDGVIDPPGVVMTEGAAVPQAPIAGEGTWWVQNLVPNVPMFTDDAGTDHVIVTNVTRVWEYAAGPLLRPLATGDGYDINADFVFGSQSLDDAGGASDARFFFDKGAGSFRAGQVDGTQWDAGSRGDHSVAFGENTTASGPHSAVGGGDSNTATNTGSVVGGGLNNDATGANAVISGGSGNTASGTESGVGGGATNTASNTRTYVAGGTGNTASGVNAVAFGGAGIDALAVNSAALGGSSNTVAAASAASVVVGGGTLSIATTASGCGIFAGLTNTIAAAPVGNSTILGGITNSLSGGSNAAICGGDTNTISTTAGSNDTILGGTTNTITGGGGGNSTILGGDGNTITAATTAVICGGNGNTIGPTSGSNSWAGGESSTINGHDNAFVWSDGTGGRSSTADDEVTFGAAGGFRVFGAGAGGGPAYVGGEIYLDASSVVVTGKLTVTGIIDPPALTMTESTTVPGGAPAMGSGTLWVRDDTPNVLVFTDDAGTDTVLGGGGGSSPWEWNAAVLRADAAAPGYNAAGDFVFGSQQLDSGGSTTRVLFDYSQAAFRAGVATGTQWDAGNRGLNSVAFGSNNTASGGGAVITGGTNNVASGADTFIGGGNGNTASNLRSAVASGFNCDSSGSESLVAGGSSNDATGTQSAVCGGSLNVAASTRGGVYCGSSNQVTTAASDGVVIGGTSNQVDALSGVIIGCNNSRIFTGGGGTNSVLLGGDSLTVGVSAVDVVIAGGFSNSMGGTAQRAVILGGDDNAINFAGNNSVICGGASNLVSEAGCWAGGGTTANGGSTIAVGHTGAFVWSDSSAGQSSTAANEVTFGAAGGFRVFGAGAGGGPVYVGGEIYLDASSVVVTGKLTVTGIIDPPALTMTESTTVPGGAPAMGSGTLWVRDDTPNVLVFTDDAGTDAVLRAGPWEWNAAVLRTDTTAPGYNAAGDFVFGSQSLDDAGAASDARFFFDKSVGSFRAGQVDGTQWDAGSRGDHSAAFGENTTASGIHSAVGGGFSNTASGPESFAAGGDTNTASGTATATLAGTGNTSNTTNTCVIGGNGHNITSLGTSCGILGGATHSITAGSRTVVCGGDTHTLSANGANNAIMGGNNNSLTGTSNNSIICAGSNNTITTPAGNSWAGGGNATLGATVGHSNSFVWADDDAGGRASSTNNQITFGCRGGARFFSAVGSGSGVSLAAGASAWAAVCDRNMKENFRPLEGVLARVEALPVYEYNYKGQAADMTCRGPVAQDWHEAFPSAKDQLKIETMDLDGVALAAIKELAGLVRSLQAEVAELRGQPAAQQ